MFYLARFSVCGNQLTLFLNKFEYIIVRLSDKEQSNMGNADPSRSEEVVEHYKRRKLALSALRKIQAVLLGFEKDRAFDLRIAAVGVVVILLIVGIASFSFVSIDTVTLP